jgi:NitT/TauT family transport system substrate-binding protein
VRRATRRIALGAAALVVVALAAAGVAVALDATDGGNGDGDEATMSAPSGPRVPGDIGDGCGGAAATDPTDMSVGRTLARCGAGAPVADPLRRPATVRVALSERSESAAPLLVADALGELEAENLAVEIVEMPQRDAYRAMAAGDVDVVVGGVDGAFFDAVHDGLRARLVLGGSVARAPGDVDTAQAGLWLRADLLPEDDGDEWDNVEGQPVVVPGGLGGAALYPIETLLGQHALEPNVLDIEPGSATAAAERLQAAAIGGAWLTEPAATRAAGDSALRLVATAPGSESIEGTVFAPRLLGDDRPVGLAYARAIVRTINTHLVDGYTDEARAALATALDVSEDEVADGTGPLFDWEVRAGTTTRIQEALVMVGGIGYEIPESERGLVDRSVAADVVAAG